MLDFRKIEAFCKVYELRSFSKAGEALFLSQPTVSAHVQALEREIGAILLDRLGRTVLPTPAGEILYKYASLAFDNFAAAKNEIDCLTGGVSGEISIGASSIPALYLLPDIASAFTDDFPQVNLRLLVGDSSSIVRSLIAGDVLLGLVGALEKHPELEFETIINDELVLVAAPKLSGLGQGGSILSLSELYAWPWIMREEGSGTRKAFEAGFIEAGGDLRGLKRVVELDSSQAALQYALTGMGVTVMSRLAVKQHLECGELFELKVADLRFERKFYLVRNIRRKLFPAAQEFAAYIKKRTRNYVTI